MSRLPAGGSAEGVAEPQPRKAAEVTVGRIERAVVLDRQGREVGVAGEVAGGARVLDQQPQDAPVAGSGLHHRDQRMLQLALHQFKRLGWAEGLLHQSALGADP